jgi:hypothetical protein
VPDQHGQKFHAIYPIRFSSPIPAIDFDAGWINHDIFYPDAF